MKNNKGFTFVELMVVVIIVSILSLVSVAVYRGYINKAKMAEGEALLRAIADAEEIYYAANDVYLLRDSYGSALLQKNANTDKNFNINAGTNKYFTTFKISGNAASSAVIETKDSSGITLKLTIKTNAKAVSN